MSRYTLLVVLLSSVTFMTVGSVFANDVISQGARNLSYQAVTGEIAPDVYLHPVDRLLHRVIDRLVSKEAVEVIQKELCAEARRVMKLQKTTPAKESAYPELYKQLRYVSKRLGYKGELTLHEVKNLSGSAGVTSIGKGKDVLCFDPAFVKRMSALELRALLAHELAHLKLKHGPLRKLIDVVMNKKMSTLLGALCKGRAAVELKDVEAKLNNHLKRYPGNVRGFISGYFNRINEFSADRAAIAATGTGKHMASVLSKPNSNSKQTINYELIIEQCSNLRAGGLTKLDKVFKTILSFRMGAALTHPMLPYRIREAFRFANSRPEYALELKKCEQLKRELRSIKHEISVNENAKSIVELATGRGVLESGIGGERGIQHDLERLSKSETINGIEPRKMDSSFWLNFKEQLAIRLSEIRNNISRIRFALSKSGKGLKDLARSYIEARSEHVMLHFNAILVTEQQFPELHKIVQSEAKKLSIRNIPTYVVPEGTYGEIVTLRGSSEGRPHLQLSEEFLDTNNKRELIRNALAGHRYVNPLKTKSNKWRAFDNAIKNGNLAQAQAEFAKHRYQGSYTGTSSALGALEYSQAAQKALTLSRAYKQVGSNFQASRYASVALHVTSCERIAADQASGTATDRRREVGRKQFRKELVDYIRVNGLAVNSQALCALDKLPKDVRQQILNKVSSGSRNEFALKFFELRQAGKLILASDPKNPGILEINKNEKGNLRFSYQFKELSVSRLVELVKTAGSLAAIPSLCSLKIYCHQSDKKKVIFARKTNVNLMKGEELRTVLVESGFTLEQANRIVKARRNGPFINYKDLLTRTGLKANEISFYEHKRPQIFKRRMNANRKVVRLAKVASVRSGQALGHTVQTLFTIIVMHMATECYYTGKTDVNTALHALNSPEMVLSLPFAGLATKGVSKISKPAEVLLSRVGSEKLVQMLKPLGKNIVTLVAFEFVGAFAREATMGMMSSDDELSFTRIMKNSELRKKYFANLARLLSDGERSGQIIGTLFKERILSAEFGMLVAGMVAGTKIGATVGRVGYIAGPKGGAAGQVIGGLVGGVVGAVGGTVIGKSVDVAWKQGRLAKKREFLLEHLTRKSTGDFSTDYAAAKDCLNFVYDYEEYREKTIELLASLYTVKLAKLANTGDEELRKDAEEIKNKMLNIYQQDLQLLNKLIEAPNASEAQRDFLIQLENNAVIAKAVIQAQLLNFSAVSGDTQLVSADEDLMAGLEYVGP